MSSTTTHRGARRAGRRPQRADALTPAQLRALEAELQRERARLERSLMDDAGPRGAGDVAADGGVALQAPAFESRAQARHAAIVDALGRLEQGSYGRCVDCGERIPYGRLLVMPDAQHCIACGPRI